MSKPTIRVSEAEAANDFPSLLAQVLRLVSKEIDQLAAEMGFTPRQVVEREFRAERENGRIVRLITAS